MKLNKLPKVFYVKFYNIDGTNTDDALIELVLYSVNKKVAYIFGTIGTLDFTRIRFDVL